jgi:hypothetical protein
LWFFVALSNEREGGERERRGRREERQSEDRSTLGLQPLIGLRK